MAMLLDCVLGRWMGRWMGLKVGEGEKQTEGSGEGKWYVSTCVLVKVA